MRNRCFETLVLSLATGLAANFSWGQQPNQLYVQNLPLVGELPQSTMPRPNSNVAEVTPITLETIPRATPPAPLKLEPLQRVPRSNAVSADAVSYSPSDERSEQLSVSKRELLSVDAMINQQPNVSILFSRVSSPDDARSIEASLAPVVRSQLFQDHGEAEWAPYGYAWQSPAFCYSRLYFEQPNLERYGANYGHILSPAISATHFYGTTLTLPFKAIVRAPWTCDCTLGHHRPGNCAPHQRKHSHFVQQSMPLAGPAIERVEDEERVALSPSQYPNLTDQISGEPISTIATDDVDTGELVTTAGATLSDPGIPESGLPNAATLGAPQVVYRSLSDTSQK